MHSLVFSRFEQLQHQSDLTYHSLVHTSQVDSTSAQAMGTSLCALDHTRLNMARAGAQLVASQRPTHARLSTQIG